MYFSCVFAMLLISSELRVDQRKTDVVLGPCPLSNDDCHPFKSIQLSYVLERGHVGEKLSDYINIIIHETHEATWFRCLQIITEVGKKTKNLSILDNSLQNIIHTEKVCFFSFSFILT